eukprot:145780_1
MADSSSFIRLKLFNERLRNVIFGYIKQEQKELSSNIPMNVYYLCLAYHSHGEYFEEHGKSLQLSKDQMTITKVIISDLSPSDAIDCRAIGHEIIDSNKHIVAKWSFNIDECKNIAFGFMICNFCGNGEWRIGPKFNCRGTAMLRMGCSFNDKDEKYFMFNKGDKVSVILNTKQKTISAQKNEVKVQCIIKNIPIGAMKLYKIAVFAYKKSDQITITDFETYEE